MASGSTFRSHSKEFITLTKNGIDREVLFRDIVYQKIQLLLLVGSRAVKRLQHFGQHARFVTDQALLLRGYNIFLAVYYSNRKAASVLHLFPAV